jgi:signal peptidase II
MNAANEQETAAANRAQDGTVAREPSGWRWLPVTAVVIALDQLVKAWVVQHLTFHGTMRVLPILELTLTYNKGAAFSFLAGASGWQRWLFAGLAVVVGAGILLWLRRLSARRQRLLCLSLTLILGGALGNLIDRLRIGHVIDFILAHWHRVYFPFAFNVADSAITVGAALLLIDALLETRGSKKENV